MGVDCRILLPADVRVKDVAMVMGILAGLPKEQMPLDGGKWFVRVNGAKANGYGPGAALPGCAEITLSGKMVDRLKVHEVMYHFEAEHGVRLLMPSSTPFWLAVGRGLVDFFGGDVDYNDWDDRDVDYHKEKPRQWNDSEEDAEWFAFQQAMFDVKPLTKADLKAMQPHAHYK